MRPTVAASEGTLDDFLQAIQEFPDIDWREDLFEALDNENIESRIQIATWMLDHGVDPAWICPDEKINALHVLFSRRTNDIPAEAPLLQRIIDGGADINLDNRRWGPPLNVLLENSELEDNHLAPYYDVIFSTPGINWDIQVGPKATLKSWITNHLHTIYPDFANRMNHYLTHGPTPRPTYT